MAKKDKATIIIEEDTDDLIYRVMHTVRFEEFTLVFFISGMLLAYFVKVLEHPENFFPIFMTMLAWAAATILFHILLAKQKLNKNIKFFYMMHVILNAIWMTIITFFIGGIEWMGPIYYFFMIIYTSTTLSRKEGVIISFICSLLFASLVTLQYLKIIPFNPFFDIEPKLYLNGKYLLITCFFVTMAYYFLALAASLFTDLLKKRGKDLAMAYGEIKSLKEYLESIVVERTKQLSEKVRELEEFQGIVEGREEKIIELKEEIKKLKEKQQA